MAKLETFDDKQTKWEGLWYNPSWHAFYSSTISLAPLKAYKGTVRLKIVKNRNHKDGCDDRPNYLFKFMDWKSENPHDIRIENGGEWQYHQSMEAYNGITLFEWYACSKCGYKVGLDERHNFCPKCGSKMDAGTKYDE